MKHEPKGTLEIEKDSIVLKLLANRGVIEMAMWQGDDTEWYPIALTDAERRSLALSLLEKRVVIVGAQ